MLTIIIIVIIIINLQHLLILVRVTPDAGGFQLWRVTRWLPLATLVGWILYRQQ